MDIQKLRQEFEELPDIKGILHGSDFGFNESINQYYHPDHTNHRLNYAFLMGAWMAWQAAKAQAVSEWIDVNDRLPDIGKEVLVYLGDFGMATAHLHDELTWFIKFDEEGWYYLITHWQPLPEPPQGE